jgi:flagellar hook-basal body complex protein FliE
MKMQVDNISFINNISFAPDLPKTEQAEGRNAFEAIFQAAIRVLDETNRLQFESDWAQIDFATGRTDNILDVVMAQDRAHQALNFTVQITNRIIESYREIMRMQV